jgi:hypothetical protein
MKLIVLSIILLSNNIYQYEVEEVETQQKSWVFTSTKYNKQDTICILK